MFVTKRTVAAVAVVGIIIGAVAAWSGHSRAASTGFNATITPTSASLDAKPGTSVSQVYRIRNNSGEVEHINVSLMKFKANGEEGAPTILDFESGDDFKNWVHAEKTQFSVDPGQWGEDRVTINVPSYAANGYYYAVIFGRSGNQGSAKGATYTGGVAALLLLDAVSPSAKRHLDIASFKADKTIVEYLPETFSVRIHNAGNVHIAPQGSIIIYQGKKQIGTVDVNKQAGYILPNSNRDYTASWNDGYPVFTSDNNGHKHVSTGNLNLGKFRFGKFRAHVTMVYNDGRWDIPIEAEVTFWVIPWRLILGVVVVIFLLGVGTWVTLRRAATAAKRAGRRR